MGPEAWLGIGRRHDLGRACDSEEWASPEVWAGFWVWVRLRASTAPSRAEPVELQDVCIQSLSRRKLYVGIHVCWIAVRMMPVDDVLWLVALEARWVDLEGRGFPLGGGGVASSSFTCQRGKAETFFQFPRRWDLSSMNLPIE